MIFKLNAKQKLKNINELRGVIEVDYNLVPPDTKNKNAYVRKVRFVDFFFRVTS